MKKGKWIWYPGDFEIYHSLLLHARREERGYCCPYFGRLDSCYHNVKFKKKVAVASPEKIEVISNALGYVSIDAARGPLNRVYMLEPGEYEIFVELIKVDGLPSLYISGETVFTDESWEVNNGNFTWCSAGCNEMHTDPNITPETFLFAYEEIFPVHMEQVQGGILYDFGKETFAKLKFSEGSFEENTGVYYGESRAEALDIEHCYLTDTMHAGLLPARGFRYVFIPENHGNYKVSAEYEYYPFAYRGKFRCSDERLNKIWEVSAYTLHLNSREFFLDGLKRDRWVWSGDAYQSYLVNYYLFFDLDICKRTMLALRGKDPMEIHINTIMDYSFYWIIGVYDYYMHTGDKAFVKFLYPKMESLMAFCMERADDDGFVRGKEGDWIFIDWADLDKTGALCAEQILFARSLEIMAWCCELLGYDDSVYHTRYLDLRTNIDRHFWNDTLGGFVDSYESEKNNITRHANIFALLFDYVTPVQRERIIENVLLNNNVDPITTPYFKFYELEAMCRIGKMEYAKEQISAYWGGMLDLGATTIWEEFDPRMEGDEHYAMYGQKYGKSLCHAWGASPIYIFGKYYLGVRPTAAAYTAFEVQPDLAGLDWIDGTVPVNGGEVSVYMDKNVIKITSTVSGGTLVCGKERIPIPLNQELVWEIQ